MADLYEGKSIMSRGEARKDVTAFAFGAHFVEVRIHRLTHEIRTPRVVSAFAAGTIVNPMTARSQYMGGAIWGLSSALHEATEIDTRAGHLRQPQPRRLSDPGQRRHRRSRHHLHPGD